LVFSILMIGRALHIGSIIETIESVCQGISSEREERHSCNLRQFVRGLFSECIRAVALLIILKSKGLC